MSQGTEPKEEGGSDWERGSERRQGPRRPSDLASLVSHPDPLIQARLRAEQPAPRLSLVLGPEKLVGARGWKGPKLLKEVTQTRQAQRDRGQ